MVKSFTLVIPLLGLPTMLHECAGIAPMPERAYLRQLRRSVIFMSALEDRCISLHADAHRLHLYRHEGRERP